MEPLTSQTLEELHQEMARFLEVRHQDHLAFGEPSYPCHLLICGGTGCHASKGLEIKERLMQDVAKRGLADRVMVVETGCNGYCAQGPILVVYPGEVFYQYLKPEDAEEILEQHVLRGYPVERLLYHDPRTGRPVLRKRDVPFFARQVKWVLQNTGHIAAERIEEYIGTGGYLAARKALLEMKRRPGSSTRSRPPGCAGAAGPGSRPASSGSSPPGHPGT